MTPKFELGRDFSTMQLPSEFHHPVFTRSEVIVLTHKPTNTPTNAQIYKQTPPKTSNVPRYAATLGTQIVIIIINICEMRGANSCWV